MYFIIIFNVSIFMFFYFNLSSESIKVLYSFQTLSAAVIVSNIFAAWKKTNALKNLGLFSFSVLVTALGIELLLRFSLPWLPSRILDLVDTYGLAGKPHKNIEYLNKSPFVKFKPNIHVRTVGGYLPEAEWHTDQHGFKNTQEIASAEHFDVIALGDSFTEGVWVKAEDTWPAQLTKLGYISYNTGVQGYAVTQMRGVAAIYVPIIKPRWCILGYTGTIFGREEAFFDEERAIKEKSFTGGITYYVKRQQYPEVREQHPLVLLATARTAYYTTREKISRMMSPKSGEFSKIISSKLLRYRADIERIETNVIKSEQISNDPAYRQFLSNLKRLRKICADNSARMLVVYIPHIGTTYFKRATGKKLPADAYELVEAQLIKDFAENNGIEYLDLLPTLQRYVDGLPGDMDFDELPYNHNEGHLSPRGLALMAQLIASFLRKTEG